MIICFGRKAISVEQVAKAQNPPCQREQTKWRWIRQCLQERRTGSLAGKQKHKAGYFNDSLFQKGKFKASLHRPADAFTTVSSLTQPWPTYLWSILTRSLVIMRWNSSAIFTSLQPSIYHCIWTTIMASRRVAHSGRIEITRVIRWYTCIHLSREALHYCTEMSLRTLRASKLLLKVVITG